MECGILRTFFVEFFSDKSASELMCSCLPVATNGRYHDADADDDGPPSASNDGVGETDDDAHDANDADDGTSQSQRDDDGRRLVNDDDG